MVRTENSACPGDEALLAHMLAPSAASGSLAGHLQQCDRCVDEMARVQQRLLLAEEIARPLPLGLIDRATERPRQPVAARSEPSWWTRVLDLGREALAGLRPVSLIPVAVAAAALLVLVREAPVPDAPAPVELTRNVDLAQPARITRATAELRQNPEAAAPSLRSLARGDAVVLFERRDDWYLVSLSDGTKGWIEVAAFE